MAITIDATRPKANQDQEIALSLEMGTPVENDTADSFFVSVNATGLEIPDFSITDISSVSGSDLLTTTDNGFVDVQIGDTIAAGTNTPAATVIAKTDDNNIQISANATADGTESLTFSPQGGGTGLAVSLAGLKISLIQTANKSLKAVVSAHLYDGSLGSTPGTDLNSASELNLNEFDIDIDSLFTTARIPRTN